MAGHKQLTEESVDKDPFLQFEKWYSSRLVSGVDYPDAFCLATASRHGDVSQRMILLKAFSREGFVFFTNYQSRKGQQISENNRAAMLFFWPEDKRQVRIEGRVRRLLPEESYMYFSTRTRESRLGAWASDQSTPIADKKFLIDRYNEFRQKFRGENVPLPPHWGGFRLVPLWFEFWQEGNFRLHDRISYQPVSGGWKIIRLAP